MSEGTRNGERAIQLLCIQETFIWIALLSMSLLTPFRNYKHIQQKQTSEDSEKACGVFFLRAYLIILLMRLITMQTYSLVSTSVRDLRMGVVKHF